MPPGNPYGYIGDNPLRMAFVTQQQATDSERSPFSPLGKFGSKDKQERERLLAAAALQAGNFAGQGEAGYGAMTAEMAKDREALRALASGQNSIAAEQLRQGMQQNVAAQRSMAASASPQNAVMASRNAMMNANRAGYGMSGQAALAGLQERRNATELLAQMNAQQRGQDIQVGLGSRENQLTGLGANKPDKPKGPSTGDKILQGIGYGMAMFSDERLKTNVKDGDKAVRRALSKLSAKSYDYKDERHGKGEQLGILAQDLEKVVPDAVIDTPEGKAVHGAKLAGAATAMVVSLGKRMAKLEKGHK